MDNVSMESFFHIMKAELFDQTYTTKDSLIQATTEWLDYYNQRRIKTKLKGRTPVQYRQLALQSVA
ncbi:hypothetical protein OKN36_00360 [Furfurilactobacillus sp. OKN36]